MGHARVREFIDPAPLVAQVAAFRCEGNDAYQWLLNREGLVVEAVA